MDIQKQKEQIVRTNRIKQIREQMKQENRGHFSQKRYEQELKEIEDMNKKRAKVGLPEDHEAIGLLKAKCKRQ